MRRLPLLLLLVPAQPRTEFLKCTNRAQAYGAAWLRACTATPRDEDVVDVSSGDAELARMMARFEGQDGLDYGRVAPAAPSRPARPPPPPVYEDAWREPEPVVFADDDDDFSLGGGGAAPWDVIQ